MALYQGDRTIDGILVTRDGEALDPGLALGDYSEIGLDWGFVGPASRQLSFALLIDHLKDPARARAMVESFTRHITAELDNEWELETADLAVILSRLQPAS